MKKIILSLFFFISSITILKADLIEETSKKLFFSIKNLNKFSEYEFYYLRKTILNNGSEQTIKADTLKIEKDQFYIGGDKGENTILLAKKNGKFIGVSNMELKGRHQIDKKKINKASQIIKIIAVKNGVISFEVVKYKLELDNGKTKYIKSEFNSPLFMLGFSVLALLFLSLLFHNRNQSAGF